MHLKRLELNGFKSFAKKSEFVFDVPIIAIVGPNGSGKSNVVESIRFVLGEQSVKSMRGKSGSDLIFKGSREVSKMSRASVTIVFDNSDRVFHIHHHNNAKINVDFDEVAITREVYADGGNKYFINGNEVRMKDVHELIGSVNIGASGHHIISQGEADRYLNANVKDRRALIEEALGLKVYQYRLKESLRKLEKSESNMRESELLRRELVPHLRFLKRQVDKIEKAKGMRNELKSRYHEYFAREDFLIEKKALDLVQQKKLLDTRIGEVNIFLQNHSPDNQERKEFPEEHKILEKKSFIQDWQKKISENNREYGKTEGMLSFLEKQQVAENQEKDNKQYPDFSYVQVKDFFNKILNLLGEINVRNIQSSLVDVKNEIHSFLQLEHEVIQKNTISHQGEIDELKRKKEILLQAQSEAQRNINELQAEIAEYESVLIVKREQEQESQKKYYEYLAIKKELDGKYEMMLSHAGNLENRKRARYEEYQEALVLLGEPEIIYPKFDGDESLINSADQEQSRRELERIKIRLEDMGGGSGGDIIREFEETTQRDAFLEKEILDISTTIESLQSIITDLKKTLDTEFDAGIKKINVQFDRFFKLMFGGGSAELEPSLIKKRKKKTEEFSEELEIDNEAEKEYGIDIKVQLPRKKVSDLDMLSGGERSLTSIALLFALSQVNPPPFLVLDETDAALDEANSQKYGDMIESLSEFSQLVVVTHNRETMSRAQTLFGVTLGRGDYSSLLSLRLEDAAKYAK